MDVHGMRHALIVGPNSGYGFDNRCLLDATRAKRRPLQGRRRGAPTTRATELAALKERASSA